MKKSVVICLILLLASSVSLAGKSPKGTPGLVIDVDWGVDTYYVNAQMLGTSSVIPLYMNSADINGDGTVDLLDVTILSRDQDMLEKANIYNYRSDFNWDGAIDETDTPMMSAAWGGHCE